MKARNKILDRWKSLSDKIKKLYSKHFIGKIIITIIGICIILGTIYYIPTLRIKSNALPEIEYAGLSAAGDEIALDAGEVLVAESDSKRLYVDSGTMNIKLEDKNTGKVWNSIVQNSEQALELALLDISYLGEDDNLYDWDSYTYCTQIGSYTINQIENGVQIKMNIKEGKSERFNEYYPEKMSTDRFENFFLKGIADAIVAGTLEEATANKYKQTLELIYKKSISENCYVVAYNGTPPRSAVKQLIKLAEALGYTKEMLIADSSEMGLAVTFVEMASFDITLQATLEEEDLLVRIPTQEMVSRNDFYTIQNIKVLPNFGAAAAADYKDGYLFVPDGAGALFEFNTADSAVPDYIRPVYDNDYYSDYYFMPEYGEELMMPVFGMTYGKDENSTHGFLGIIEKGAETSYINTKLALAGKENSTSCNKVYASFDVTQYSSVKVYGPYSENENTYLADTGALDVDYTIRYKLFPDTVTYYDMAKSYQQYLRKEWSVADLDYPDQAKLYLDFIGTISLTKRFLGIPYDSSYSMTTYRELTDIINDLGDTNLTLQYSGVFNGGFENKLYTEAKLVPANGSTKELTALEKLAEEKNIDLFFETSLSKIYKKGNGFSSKTHAIYDYSNEPAAVFRYSPSTGKFNYSFFEAYHNFLLSPRYLDGVVDDFMEEATEYSKISISDLACYNYPDYRFNKMISTYAASQIIDNNLKKLSLEKELSLYNPFMKNLIYGSYAEDISRESSDYATFYTTIPFRQLVMNGLTEVTTENVNMSSDSYAYYILQSVELGVYPKFTLTAKTDDILKDSSYAYYFATEYSKQKDIINKVYAECKTAWDEIGTMEITNHTILQDNVFRTEYATGVSVITNYNLHSVVVDGKEIAALGYLLVQE